MRNPVYILPCKSSNKTCNLLSTCAMLDTCVRVTHVSFLLLRASMQRKRHWPQSASRKQIYKTRWLSQGHYVLRGSAGLESPQFEISMCRCSRCKYKSIERQSKQMCGKMFKTVTPNEGYIGIICIVLQLLSLQLFFKKNKKINPVSQVIKEL